MPLHILNIVIVYSFLSQGVLNFKLREGSYSFKKKRFILI